VSSQRTGVSNDSIAICVIDSPRFQVFQADDFLTLSESMVQMIMCRNLEVSEVRKFEAMLGWARHKIRTKTSTKVDAKLEFKCIMERLARDLKLYRISPQDLIKVRELGGCVGYTRLTAYIAMSEI
jgi:RAP1 GTPase activating protein 1